MARYVQYVRVDAHSISYVRLRPHKLRNDAGTFTVLIVH